MHLVHMLEWLTMRKRLAEGVCAFFVVNGVRMESQVHGVFCQGHARGIPEARQRETQHDRFLSTYSVMRSAATGKVECNSLGRTLDFQPSMCASAKNICAFSWFLLLFP